MSASETNNSSPPILKPRPLRPSELSSSLLTAPDSQFSPHSQDASTTDPESPNNGKPDFSRSRSILNLTSSTLFGIYAPTSLADSTDTPPTPWGTGAETPVRSGSLEGGTLNGLSMSPLEKGRGGAPNGEELEERLLRRSGIDLASRGRAPKDTAKDNRPQRPASATRTSVGRILLRISVLFTFGVAYGALVAHLHDNRQIAPIKVPVTTDSLDGASLAYLAFWGLAGIGMGNLFPWVDGLTRSRKASALHAVEWNDVVRSIGAFVGIAFAIRRLPWETTLQLSLTLALANPILWYLLDRTTAGLTLSTAIGLLGTGALLAINPALIPAPTSTFPPPSDLANSSASVLPSAGSAAAAGGGSGVSGVGRNEYIGVATWIASVLFCSCVCFGNIGRLLVPGSERR